jgi:hypothetical protein
MAALGVAYSGRRALSLARRRGSPRNISAYWSAFCARADDEIPALAGACGPTRSRAHSPSLPSGPSLPRGPSLPSGNDEHSRQQDGEKTEHGEDPKKNIGRGSRKPAHGAPYQRGSPHLAAPRPPRGLNPGLIRSSRPTVMGHVRPKDLRPPHASPLPYCAFADNRGPEELVALTQLLLLIASPVRTIYGHGCNVGAAAQRHRLMRTRVWLISLPAKRTPDPISVASPVAATPCTP